MNSSSSVSLPCSAAASRDRPPAESCRAKETARDRRPPPLRTCCAKSTARRLAGRRVFADLDRGSRARWPDRATPSAHRAAASAGRFSIALARLTRVCSPEESTPHFTSRNARRSNCSSSVSMRGGQVLDAVDQAEEAQILSHGQIAGQRRVDGREIGALPAPASARRDVEAFDPEWSRESAPALRESC